MSPPLVPVSSSSRRTSQVLQQLTGSVPLTKLLKILLTTGARRLSLAGMQDNTGMTNMVRVRLMKTSVPNAPFVHYASSVLRQSWLWLFCTDAAVYGANCMCDLGIPAIVSMYLSESESAWSPYSSRRHARLQSMHAKLIHAIVWECRNGFPQVQLLLEGGHLCTPNGDPQPSQPP